MWHTRKRAMLYKSERTPPYQPFKELRLQWKSSAKLVDILSDAKKKVAARFVKSVTLKKAEVELDKSLRSGK